MSIRPSFLSLQRWLRDLRLRQKFTLTALVLAVTAAIAASAVLLAFRLHSLRHDQLASTLAVTQIVAENVAGAVAFEDAAAATTTLASLRAQPLVRGAVVSLPGRPDFAHYGEAPAPAVRLVDDLSHHFDGWRLLTAAPIRMESTAVGRLHIETDLRPALYATLSASLVSLLLALAFAALLGVAVSFGLRGYILAPVDHLHAAVRRIAERTDYTLRAEVRQMDELGELTTAFNQMLESLQASDTALRTANRKLETTLDERDRLEGELVETSRLAGMAQVATGVLHNVGNVLNSVNISAQLIRQSLASNPHFALLGQTADLLQAQGDKLPQFLAEDPRGRLVPRLVVELASQLTSLRAQLITESEQLALNIEHIKQIVAMQQSHAKAGGLNQRVRPTELFQEAQRLAQGSIARHAVVVTPEFAAVPEITTDRHQALQILVNFISNAVQAVKAGRAANDRVIKLGVAATEAGVKFSVTDNGVGIPSDNLDQIFRHGFTTRKDGHGFGLHSGWLAAKNLGGAIDVQSAGAGHGATFTLTLPLVPPTHPSALS